MDWIAQVSWGLPCCSGWREQRDANITGRPVVIKNVVTKQAIEVIWPEELGGWA